LVFTTYDLQAIVLPFPAAYNARMFGNPDILNMSVGISIAHQLIDILKFSVCHFQYNEYFAPSVIGSSA